MQAALTSCCRPCGVQAITIIVVEPLVMLVLLVLAFVIWPPIAPYVVWIPYVGAALGGQAAVNTRAKGPSEALTRRLEKVTLVRAAGEASKISPDAAIVAFGTEAVSHAATAAVAAIMERVHDRHKGHAPSKVRSQDGCRTSCRELVKSRHPCAPTSGT